MAKPYKAPEVQSEEKDESPISAPQSSDAEETSAEVKDESLSAKLEDSLPAEPPVDESKEPEPNTLEPSEPLPSLEEEPKTLRIDFSNRRSCLKAVLAGQLSKEYYETRFGRNPYTEPLL